MGSESIEMILVRLDGWSEIGLGRQRNNGVGCATMPERQEDVKTPGSNVDDWV